MIWILIVAWIMFVGYQLIWGKDPDDNLIHHPMDKPWKPKGRIITDEQAD